MSQFALRALCALLLLAAAVPAGALEPIGPRAFREYSEGYTLYFEQDGQPFGAESFGTEGQTTWQFSDGTCLEGVWRPHGAQICFYYGLEAEVLCWRMLRDGDEILARLLGEGPDAGMELRIVRRDRAPLLCGQAGPEL
jgi:hypothetical protein